MISGSLVLGCLVAVAAILLVLFWILISNSRENDAGMAKRALEIMLLGFLLGIIVMIGKVAVINNDNCSWLANTTTVSGNTTSYSYSYSCSTNNDNTASLLYQITLWIMRLTIAYVVIGFGFSIFAYLAGLKEKRAKGGEE